MNKKVIIAIIIFIVIVLVFSLYFSNYNSYKNIKQYVSNNENELYNIAVKMMENEKVVIPSKVNSVQVFEGENKIVQFDIKSFIKQYCGFYYSVNDIPVAFQNVDVSLKKIDDNIWKWESDGDNKGKTIKISDNWYYYEASL